MTKNEVDELIADLEQEAKSCSMSEDCCVNWRDIEKIIKRFANKIPSQGLLISPKPFADQDRQEQIWLNFSDRTHHHGKIVFINVPNEYAYMDSEELKQLRDNCNQMLENLE